MERLGKTSECHDPREACEESHTDRRDIVFTGPPPHAARTTRHPPLRKERPEVPRVGGWVQIYAQVTSAGRQFLSAQKTPTAKSQRQTPSYHQPIGQSAGAVSEFELRPCPAAQTIGRAYATMVSVYLPPQPPPVLYAASWTTIPPQSGVSSWCCFVRMPVRSGSTCVLLPHTTIPEVLSPAGDCSTAMRAEACAALRGGVSKSFAAMSGAPLQGQISKLT